MIDIEEKLLDSLIYKAKMNAIEQGSSQLLSLTKKIAPAHIIGFFEAAHKMQKNRLFWADVDNDFYIVGVGNIKTITAREDRYSELETQWKESVSKALIHNPFSQAGTGLLAMGGMSFDPLKKGSTLWSNFPTGELTIPEFTLVKNKSDYHLTINTIVHAHEDINELIKRLETEEKALCKDSIKNVKQSNHVLSRREIEPEKWIDAVRLAREEIRSDRAKKIVLAREMRLKLNKDAHISAILKNLLKTQPNSYVFALEKGTDCFVGATPERLVRVDGNNLLSTCLAGTAPRGHTSEADKQVRQDLLNDEKNLEEHEYVVQMIKQSIDPYCENVNIPKYPMVYPLKDLHHLYTPVTATLKQGYSIFDLIKQLHPTPALGGVPRKETLAFIREHELLDRGWYGAPVGWIDNNLNGEFAVAIRSGLIQKDEVSLFAGCGVMKDSDPQMEYEETNVKFLPMLNVLEDHNELY